MRKELITLLFLLAAIAAKGQTLTVRATFDTPFAYNYPPPVTGPDGNLYGTSGTGIYRVTPAGTVSTVYTFTGNDGSTPAGLTLGSDGNLYGVGESGGANGFGTTFRITPAGQFTVLHTFDGTDGCYPVTRLLQGRDGGFYGTTYGYAAAYAGGECAASSSYSNSWYGTVFKMAPDGTVTTLHRFAATANGAFPDGTFPTTTLIEGADGSIYGGTEGLNGTGALGTIFRISPGGSFQTLYTFARDAPLYGPSSLIPGTGGNLYGTRMGAEGIFFVLNSAGAFKILHSFYSEQDGLLVGDLVSGVDGNFYGITRGVNVIQLTPAGKLTVIAQSPTGYEFPKGLFQGSDGLYGVVQNLPNYSKASVVRVVPPPPPAAPLAFVSMNGIAPVYSSLSAIQSGEWVSIYGSDLANSTVVWNGDFPTSLGGTSVTIDGKLAYLWFVSPGQINLQVPDDTNYGSVPVVVTTVNGSYQSTVNLGGAAPSFSLLDSEHVAGIILRSNGSGAYGGGTYDILGPTGTSLGYPTVAARPGDTVELFGVGFGPVDATVPAGQTFSGSAPVSSPIDLTVNNVKVTPSFVGLVGAGLYQINVTIPPGLGSGDVSIQAAVFAVQSPSGVVISLQ